MQAVNTIMVWAWVAAIVAAVLVLGAQYVVSGRGKYASPRWWYRRAYWPVIGGCLGFLVVIVAGLAYILTHLTDPQWAVGRKPPFTVPQLQGGPLAGVVSDVVRPWLQEVANQANAAVSGAVAAQAAFEAATHVAIWGLWALAILVPIGAMAWLDAFIEKRLLRFRVRDQARQIVGLNKDVGVLMKTVFPNGPPKR